MRPEPPKHREKQENKGRRGTMDGAENGRDDADSVTINGDRESGNASIAIPNSLHLPNLPLPHQSL